MKTPADRLIVALDCPTVQQALQVVAEIGPSVSFYKIGWRMYLMGGMEIVQRVRDQDKKVFLDLKMDDIPETISTAVEVLRDKVQLLTLFGTSATVRAAVAGRGSATNPKLLSVTYLSSMDEQDLRASLPPGGVYPEGRPFGRLHPAASLPNVGGGRGWLYRLGRSQ